MDNTSKKFSINGIDVWKTVRGVLITLLAVAITAVIDYVSGVYQNANYNLCVATNFCIDMKFIAIPLIGGIIELGRRWMTAFRY